MRFCQSSARSLVHLSDVDDVGRGDLVLERNRSSRVTGGDDADGHVRIGAGDDGGTEVRTFLAAVEAADSNCLAMTETAS